MHVSGTGWSGDNGEITYNYYAITLQLFYNYFSRQRNTIILWRLSLVVNLVHVTLLMSWCNPYLSIESVIQSLFHSYLHTTHPENVLSFSPSIFSPSLSSSFSVSFRSASSSSSLLLYFSSSLLSQFFKSICFPLIPWLLELSLSRLNTTFFGVNIALWSNFGWILLTLWRT